MVELSPAAQAVMDTFHEITWSKGYRSPLAAALRSVVQELKYVGITEKNILAIATELEGHDAP
jgi:hypothetical protein